MNKHDRSVPIPQGLGGAGGPQQGEADRELGLPDLAAALQDLDADGLAGEWGVESAPPPSVAGLMAQPETAPAWEMPVHEIDAEPLEIEFESGSEPLPREDRWLGWVAYGIYFATCAGFVLRSRVGIDHLLLAGVLLCGVLVPFYLTRRFRALW